MLRNFLLSVGFIALFFHGCGSTTPAPKVLAQPLEQNVTKPTTPSLTISAPEGATIKILNIKPKYYDGIELEAGNYLLEVSKSGYKTYTEWIKVDKPTIHTLSLEKETLSLKIVWSYDHQRFYTLYDPKTDLIWAMPSEYVDFVEKYAPKEYLPKTIDAVSKQWPRIDKTKLDTFIYNTNGSLTLYKKSKISSQKEYYGTLNKLTINDLDEEYRIPTKQELQKNNPFKKYQQYFQVIWNKGNIVKMNLPLLYAYEENKQIQTSYMGYKKGDHLYNGEQSSYINNLAHAHNIALVTPVTEKNSKLENIIYATASLDQKFLQLYEQLHSENKTIKALLGDPKLKNIFYDKKKKRLHATLYSTTNNYTKKISIKCTADEFSELKEKLLDERLIPSVNMQYKDGALHYKSISLKANTLQAKEAYTEAKRSENINYYREYIRLYPKTSQAKTLQKLIDEQYANKYKAL